MVARHPITLWLAFVLVHLWLGWVALYGPGLPLGDVVLVYKFWVQHGLLSHQWVGLDTSWVYPIVALLPMVAAYLFGPELYASTWLSLVMLVDAGAFVVVMRFGRDRRVAHVAWWWLGLLLALGPVAVGRIDEITVPVAIVGVLYLATAPRLAGALLAVAAWIKVWPAALIAAAVIALKSRARVVIAAVTTSAVILLVGLALGGGVTLFSFFGQQTGRGLQIESGLGTFWMWDAFTQRPGASSLYYDTSILTFQLRGPGVDVAAALATPILGVAAALLLGLALLRTRQGVPAARLLPPLTLALTTALILFNKVGSPQFVTWLAVPIILGLTTAASGLGPSFRTPATLGLVIAGLTQLIYPYLYDQLLNLNFAMLLVLSARNFLYLVLLIWAVRALLELRAETSAPARLSEARWGAHDLDSDRDSDLDLERHP
jgi:hypothetical protein